MCMHILKLTRYELNEYITHGPIFVTLIKGAVGHGCFGPILC